MGLRLRVLSWWTPKFVIRKELSNVSNQTVSALESALAAYGVRADTLIQATPPQASIEGQRAAMAQTHAQLVEALEAAVGREQAEKRCRELLFAVGRNLGEETRSRLGVGNSQKDLIRAAKILYRILGIRFELERIGNRRLQLIVDRCALVDQYSALTCEVLSATDEGVITGLQPRATMRFAQYMTDGCRTCTADVHFNEVEAVQ